MKSVKSHLELRYRDLAWNQLSQWAPNLYRPIVLESDMVKVDKVFDPFCSFVTHEWLTFGRAYDILFVNDKQE